MAERGYLGPFHGFLVHSVSRFGGILMRLRLFAACSCLMLSVSLGITAGISKRSGSNHIRLFAISAQWLSPVLHPTPLLGVPILGLWDLGWAMSSSVFLVACAHATFRVRRARARANAGLCTQCGYDLRGTPMRCSECGCEGTGPATLQHSHLTSLANRIFGVALLALFVFLAAAVISAFQ